MDFLCAFVATCDTYHECSFFLYVAFNSKKEFMKKNMGTIDKAIRIIVALIFVALYLTGVVTGVWGTVLLVVSGIFILTSLIGFCPLYILFGINTCRLKAK